VCGAGTRSRARTHLVATLAPGTPCAAAALVAAPERRLHRVLRAHRIAHRHRFCFQSVFNGNFQIEGGGYSNEEGPRTSHPRTHSTSSPSAQPGRLCAGGARASYSAWPTASGLAWPVLSFRRPRGMVTIGPRPTRPRDRTRAAPTCAKACMRPATPRAPRVPCARRYCEFPTRRSPVLGAAARPSPRTSFERHPSFLQSVTVCGEINGNLPQARGPR